MDVRFRPIGTWPGPSTTADRRGSRWSFRAGWTDTLNLLEHELGKLKARDVVIQIALSEGDIRMDGWPRANAPQPYHPGVIVAFGSKHGPLQYATDAYELWQHNVRAIALGLEALRKVDRYGITRRGEQYTGWKQLGAGEPVAMGAAAMTAEEAAAFLVDHGEWGDVKADPEDLIGAPEVIALYYRSAAKRLHPDACGSTEDFQRLQEAKALLDSIQAVSP
jgi:hypothetical protein